MGENKLVFPPGFIWGTASSAYQVEGAWDADGRGLSIWDTFCRQPGAVERGENGDIAADHYHRWREDVQLMQTLGLNAYRFSIAWPRILPEGRGAVNQPGLDYYDRLVDALLEKGITPFVTLYHWDLPQALQGQGGWTERATVDAFGQYAAVVAERLGDRVEYWIPQNEPMVAALIGHFLGMHAPGIQDINAAFKAGLNLLISHGAAVQALRATCRLEPKIAITLNLSPVSPASQNPLDMQAAHLFDLVTNRFFLDPVLLGSLPHDLETLLALLGISIGTNDMKIIASPIDFLGVNYYSRTVIRHDPQANLIQADQVHPQGNEYSQMWEIYPPGIYEILKMLQTEYLPRSHAGLRLIITENGICVPDGVDFDGRVRDERRIRYLRSHLEQVHKAIAEGVPLDGYFAWSLTDNFEWAFGYRMRFGLVYVDFAEQTRIIKDSGFWFKQVIRNNAVTG